MSVLDAEHKEDTVVSHKHLLQGTAKLPFGRRGYQEHTLGLCQHRRNLFGSGGCETQSSGTRDTPRSIQMDSHSLRASSAMNHVIWQSRQHKVRRGYEDFFWKGFHCTEELDTRFVHVCWVLIAIAVPVVLGIVWKAKVVNSTTLMSVTFSAYYTCKVLSTMAE